MFVISQASSLKLSRLSFVATIMVVFLHSYDNALATSRDGSFAWWLQEFVSQGICRVAVPYFFAVFGFMLFKDWRGGAEIGLVGGNRRCFAE